MAACIFMLLTACSGEKMLEYEELTAAAPDSMELTSLQNSLIKVSYPKDDWIGQPMTDPLLVVYAETAGGGICGQLQCAVFRRPCGSDDSGGPGVDSADDGRTISHDHAKDH